MPFREDQSDGRAYPDVYGVRERELERVGVVPPSRYLPRHVLRMAPAEAERRSGVVQGPFARAAAMPTNDRCSDCREGDRGSAALSLSGTAQAARLARPPGAGDRLAGGVDDWEHSQARGADLAGEAPSPSARPAASLHAGAGAERRVERGLQGLVSHPRPVPGRSPDGGRQPQPLPDRTADRRTDDRGRPPPLRKSFPRAWPAAGNPLRQWFAVRLARRRRSHHIVGLVAEARHYAALHPSGLAAGERSP